MCEREREYALVRHKVILCVILCNVLHGLEAKCCTSDALDQSWKRSKGVKIVHIAIQPTDL